MTVQDKTEGLGTLGKILFATLGANAVGRPVATKLRGDRAQLETIAYAAAAEREFQEELERPDANVETVVASLEKRQAAISKFERTFDVPWPI